MPQTRFKMHEINLRLVAAVVAEPATQYYVSMSFQLGCAIGELMGMGISVQDMRQVCNQIIDAAEAVRNPSPKTTVIPS